MYICCNLNDIWSFTFGTDFYWNCLEEQATNYYSSADLIDEFAGSEVSAVQNFTSKLNSKCSYFKSHFEMCALLSRNPLSLVLQITDSIFQCWLL